MEMRLVASKERLWKRIELAADSPRLLYVIEVEIRSAAGLASDEREMMLGRVWMYSDDVRRADAASLPAGLEVCHTCGEVRGTIQGGRASACLCEGIDCRLCTLGRIRRPISDHFDPEPGSFWHTPYFASISPCEFCQATALRLTGNAFPADLRPASPVRELLAEIHRVAAELRTECAAPVAGGLIRIEGSELRPEPIDLTDELFAEVLVRWTARADRHAFGR